MPGLISADGAGLHYHTELRVRVTPPAADLLQTKEFLRLVDEAGDDVEAVGYGFDDWCATAMRPLGGGPAAAKADFFVPRWMREITAYMLLLRSRSGDSSGTAAIRVSGPPGRVESRPITEICIIHGGFAMGENKARAFNRRRFLKTTAAASLGTAATASLRIAVTGAWMAPAAAADPAPCGAEVATGGRVYAAAARFEGGRGGGSWARLLAADPRRCPSSCRPHHDPASPPAAASQLRPVAAGSHGGVGAASSTRRPDDAAYRAVRPRSCDGGD